MQRVCEIKSAGQWNIAGAIDRVVLDAGDRQRRRIVLSGEKGTSFLLDFPRPVNLRDGDGLVLEDGAIVQVCGARESLIEIGTKTPLEFVRLAWHIGNRHTDLQIADGKLRIRRDHVLEEMVRGLGGMVSAIEVPFDPEIGVRPEHEHGG